MKVCDMLKTLVANQNRPPPEHPHRNELLFQNPNNHDHEEMRNQGEFEDNDNAKGRLGERERERERERDIYISTLRDLIFFFSRFDGDNPATWTYKANQFFDYYQTVVS
jgi:hypothetical protein